MSNSIYFMLGMVFFGVPGLIGLFLWNAYRVERRRPADGGYTPRGGAIRWQKDS